MDQLEIELQHVDGGVWVILRGELDLGQVTDFETTLRPLVARYDLDQVTVDCRELAFLDAAGLTALLQLGRAFSGSGRLTLCEPGRAVLLVLEGAGARDEFRLVDAEGAELSLEPG